MAILPTGIGPVTGYNIERSLRFNSADSAYLNRTPASAGNRKTFTWSAWVKRGTLGSYTTMFSGASSGSIMDYISFDTNNKFLISAFNGTDYIITTLGVFRDPSAWYHLVVAVDTTQVTSTNRIKLYVNGVNQTDTSGSYPTQNYDTQINNNVIQYVGYNQYNYWNGYLTEINLIDGQALTPSSFGETDAITGVWKPKAYSGTYGTNGFFLKFADNSGTTSTTLGKDSSGNGNNWTPNNFSVTAGVGNDSLVDTPTNYGTDTGAGGEVRGNYCTLNPLSTTAGTYTQGNLRYTGANAWRRSNGTLALSTGKWYWEVTLGNAPSSPRSSSSGWNGFGFGLSTVFNSTTDFSSTTDAVVLGDNGYYKNFSGSFTDGGTAFSSGDTLSIAVDLDANTYTFRRNNTQIVTGTIGGTAGRELVPIIVSYSATYGVMDCNFGQRAFTYTAPSGFKALCTQNLPTPTIGATSTTQAGDYFNTVLYTGNGTSQTISGVGFQPDFVWQKIRSQAYSHRLYDAVRGATYRLQSNTTDAEVQNLQGITAFTSDGFSVGSDLNENESGATMVAWNWNAGGSNATNTSGSITSTVRASTTAGFSVVTYTGTGSNATVGHGLGVAPSMIIIKRRSAITEWAVGHSSLTSWGYYLKLNSTAAQAASSAWWNNTAPTSTVFSLGSEGDVNASAGTYVAYCFAPVAGYSAFGSYTGNGNADGPFAYLGFRARWILIKSTGASAEHWMIYDTARNTYNVSNTFLVASASNAELTTRTIDINSNGFKVRDTDTKLNTNAETYIYAAFAENPFKHSLAR